MERVKEYINKEKKLILTALIFGIGFTVFFVFGTRAYSENIQAGISGDVLRLHILANSDEDYDQKLKIQVRDSIINNFQKELNSSKSKEETIKIINENLDEIEKCALNVIRQKGYNYTVKASVTRDYFPTKVYCDATFPKGEYDALKVVIGKGEGKNWWCVLFPPLCFVDLTYDTLPEQDKKELKEILTPEEYNIILNSDKNNIYVDFKFKIVEFWQKNNA